MSCRVAAHVTDAQIMAVEFRGIATGERADFVIFRWHAAEKRIELVETIVSGETVWRAP